MSVFRIPEIAKQYIDYDMIQDHTNLPEFPEFRTRLLFAFLSRNAAPEPNSELYSLVTSLVQMGLDTHDLVPLSNHEKERPATRSRQLKVLAGDYFSSRFYNLLSQAGQIEMIQQLSQAICEVNRLKMNFYIRMKQLKMSAEVYILETINIKTQLYLSFSKARSDLQSNDWADILQGYTHCEVILQELFRIDSLHNFCWSWSFWYMMQFGTKEEKKFIQSEEPDKVKLRSLMLKYNVSAQLYQKLDEQLQHISLKTSQLHSEKLRQEIIQIGEPFTRYLTNPQVIK